MSRLKKFLLGIAITVAVLVVLFLVMVGPWPVYKDAKFETARYYRQALAAIDENVLESQITRSPGPLKAGWGVRIITPPAGVPLAGYSSRGGAPSTGARDDLHVKALALSDGKDTAVLVGSDMLIIPPNIAQMVRDAVTGASMLTANDILFTASHTHCGPGSLGPGIAAYVTGGSYDPKVPEFLAKAFTEAILEANARLEAAKLAHGAIDAPQYIRNREHKGAEVDSTLHYLVVEQQDGDTCYLLRYSAHPTNFGGSMREFSAEYPGELMRHIEEKTRATAIYLGGAVGSMGPRAPEAPNASARVRAMGEALGNLVLEKTSALEYETNLDVVSVGVALGMPSFQMRPLSTKWRVSPFLAKIAGVPNEGWIQGVRVGNVLFVGLPFDSSGEISLEWQRSGQRENLDVWMTSFCAAYCGYLSPDRYYLENPPGYETGLMNWFGPNTEAYFRALYEHIKQALGPAATHAEREDGRERAA